MSKSVDVVNQVRRAPGAREDVLEAIHGVMHLYRSRQYRVLRDSPQAVTHMESKVLGFVARHPGATQSELVAQSGRDKGQLARLVGGLKERGLLDARPDEADRRVLRLQLTAQGQAADQALRRQARRLSGVAVQGFSDAERAQLADLLERVRRNLEAADDA
ncbi:MULTISPECIES: MarR family winged helix-turn-helix transcriptional regulator [Ramlibacter]|uniref:MarR family transcriptional regulator n=1 Tax=Ramlibacter pinisoli TaxID=2682844 RepID=A0A6N8IVS8_9BURK|nr:MULTISPECIES: MarR family winged helix-turn-helix transcriptional regulator [Ramlibacter]MBA2961117.1 winged helix-turn-helix transcriptional regulator [Ramlibacter sp. CGMCC 1.13660]MVQ31061.1 MarR family transcriptional regulator [Ramlibacter pinisoli]